MPLTAAQKRIYSEFQIWLDNKENSHHPTYNYDWWHNLTRPEKEAALVQFIDLVLTPRLNTQKSLIQSKLDDMLARIIRVGEARALWIP
ncbi:hypothetical protein LCGC14_2387820 [marine sediment metagenome]|uniref:Uncharacterized protein n=2 Tax=root TaxID=1 RepID=A0A831QQG4_9FLAO|nr:hypothetical protein [Pricia antarctica]